MSPVITSVLPVADPLIAASYNNTAGVVAEVPDELLKQGPEAAGRAL
jgi:hypothetical protein